MDMLARQILKRGMGIPLFFFLMASAPAWAQQTDTTRQSPPQLQTLPQGEARPAPPKRQAPVIAAPAPMPADTVKPRQSVDKQPNEAKENEAKEKEAFDLLKKLFVGGSATLGLQSSGYYGTYFNIGASPLLGYKVTKFLAFGPGLIYQFYTMGGYRSHDYGAKFFGQASLFKGILLHAEHSVVNSQDFQTDQQGRIMDRYRTTLATTLVGGGYRSMVNNRFGMDLYLLFPVRYSTYTYNQNYSPVIRAGFIYHLK